MTIEKIRRIAQALADRHPIPLTDDERQQYNEACLRLIEEAQRDFDIIPKERFKKGVIK